MTGYCAHLPRNCNMYEMSVVEHLPLARPLNSNETTVYCMNTPASVRYAVPGDIKHSVKRFRHKFHPTPKWEKYKQFIYIYS